MNNLNLQISEFCQQCQNVQNIKGTPVKREETTSEGVTKSVVTISYHCEVCHTFVRSEEHEPEKKETI